MLNVDISSSCLPKMSAFPQNIIALIFLKLLFPKVEMFKTKLGIVLW